MLFPNQVLPFLVHEDPIVRKHAITYFKEADDLGGLTADHLWQVIDRFGKEFQTLGAAGLLSYVPQSAASVERLIRALNSNASKHFAGNYQGVAGDMEMTSLVTHRDELLGRSALSPETRKKIELRLSFRDQNWQSAWKRLMELGRLYGSDMLPREALAEVEALVEAAARGGTEVCELAKGVLSDESSTEDWRAIFAVKLLGEARYVPAIDALLDKLTIDDDVLRSDTNIALSRIGGSSVVERIVHFFPEKPWDVRLFAHDALRHIKHASSEAGLMKLLEWELGSTMVRANEDGEPLSVQLAMDLTELCSLAGLEASRPLISSAPDDLEILGLCEGLIATSVMCAQMLPEDALWRKRIADRDTSAGDPFEMMDQMKAILLATQSRADSGEDGFDLASDDDEGVPFLEDFPGPADPEPVASPIRNAAPRIGRNDPCPCNSGKKYKKCCGKN